MDMKQTTDSLPILTRIIQSRRRHVQEAKRSLPLRELMARTTDQGPAREFRAAVSPGTMGVAVIAELKKGSPSRGVIREDFSPIDLARCFARNGASAISVLTEPDFFFGDPAHLNQVREAVDLPLLRKDFIIDPYQVYESRALGADALLLIVKVLDRPLLERLIGIARDTGMDALVEVNTEGEMETALTAGAGLIGINNRNLETLAVDRDTVVRLAPLVPDDITVVALSGIRSNADIQRYARLGLRSFLIGEMLMKIPDIRDMGRALRELTGKEADRES